jgi:hypothetical protein
MTVSFIYPHFDPVPKTIRTMIRLPVTSALKPGLMRPS